LIAFSKSTAGSLRGNRPYAVKPGVVGVLNSSQPASNFCPKYLKECVGMQSWLPCIANGRFHLDVVMSGTEWLDECARVHEAGQRSGILLKKGKSRFSGL